MNWIEDIQSWTELTLQTAMRLMDERISWRRVVHDAAKSWRMVKDKTRRDFAISLF